MLFLFDSPTLAINWDDFDKDILPPGTPDREWVDKKAARLHGLFNDCKRNGVDVYAMSDLILLPKRLVSKYGIEKTFGNPQDTLVQRILRYQLNAFSSSSLRWTVLWYVSARPIWKMRRFM